jgi:tRNA A-37 threonylcarbamoyl transferase component Bud32
VNLNLISSKKDKDAKDKSHTNNQSPTSHEFHSPQPKKRIPSPRKTSFLSPANTYLKKTTLNNQNNVNIISLISTPSKEDPENFNVDELSLLDKADKLPETSAYEGMVRLPNIREVKETGSNDDLDTVIDKSTKKFDSPSNFLRRLAPKKKEFSILSSLVKISNDETTDKVHNFDLLKNSKQAGNIDLPAMEGWIYKITESNKLKKYWLVVNNKDIYYYKTEKKDELSGMHNLSGCHIKEAPATIMGNTKLFSFVIYFQSKNRTYYCTDREQSIGWINRLRKAIGYESFFDYYEIIDDIGQGKFGVVKLGVHKNTKLRVAIKTIKKENLKTKQDQELVKTEIDIMKLCRHPHIVSLLDHFENSDYIFIVMEYIQGGDLTRYVQKYYGGKNNKTLPEKRVAELMKQFASALQYLHSYGIIHRDLKPDNLMMTEKSINAEIKIMDFGLSKMMHHDEKVADGFGTLSFVAPEVLVRKPYNSKVDVWSLGVTIYNLLSGELPFDDPNDNEEAIARKVVFADVEFTAKIWDKISKEAKAIIKECLIKDPEKRISVTKFLENVWVKNV